MTEANAENAELKARAVALVLSCEQRAEHGRLSLQDIAQTLEDNL